MPAATFLKDRVEKIHFKVFGVPMSEQMKDFILNLGYTGTSTFLVTGLMAVLQITAGRILGPVEYGKFSLLDSLAAMIYALIMTGVSTSIMYYISSDKAKRETGSYAHTGFSLITLAIIFWSVIFLLGRTFLVHWLGQDNFFVNLLWLYAVCLVLQDFSRAVLRGYHLMKWYAIIDALGGIIAFSSFFVFVYSFGARDYFSPAFSKIFSFFIFFSIGFLLSRVWQGRLDLAKIPKILSYGAATFIGWIFLSILTNSDKLIINRILSPSDLGIYYAYFLGSNAILFQALMVFLLNFFPKAVAAEEKKAVLEKILKLFNKSWWLIIIFALISTYLTLLLFGKEYPLKLEYLALIGLNALFFVRYQVSMYLINSIGIREVYQTAKILFFGAIVQLGLSWWFSQQLGLLGAFIAILITNILLSFLMLRKAKKIILN